MNQLNSVKNAFRWSFLKTIISQFLSPVLRIIAIPIIGTVNYGIFGIIYIYFGFLDSMLGAGIRDYILSKSIVNRNELSMLNFISIIWSFIFMLISILFSFYLDNIYDIREVSKFLFIMSFSFPFIGIGLVSEAITIRKLHMKKVFFIDLIPLLSTLIIVIPLALNGKGLIGLVIGELNTRIIKSLAYFFLNPVSIKFPSKILTNKVYGFIKWILGERVLEYSASTVDTFFISFLGPSVVGVYNLGKNFINISFTLLNAPLGNIWLSFYARMKKMLDDYKVIFFKFLFILIIMNLIISFLGGIYSYYIFQFLLSDWEMLNIVCLFLFISSFFRRSLWIKRDFLKTVSKLTIYPASILISLIIYSVIYFITTPSSIVEFLKIKLVYDISYFLVFIILFQVYFNFKIPKPMFKNFFQKVFLIIFTNLVILIISLVLINLLTTVKLIIYLISIFAVNLIISSAYLAKNYKDLSLDLSRLDN